ncbi:MAG TPA: tetratricopeptide repeat protein [Phycisphaerales bacterium]|nr:tetratricopeptide repeat protein [Phycisphaerales bacterium]
MGEQGRSATQRPAERAERAEAGAPAPTPPSRRVLLGPAGLLLGAGLLAGGVVAVLNRRPADDLAAPLEQARLLVEAGKHAGALQVLEAQVRPLFGSPELGAGREIAAHRLIAEATWQRAAREYPSVEVCKTIADELRALEKLGGTLLPPERERMARCALVRGDLRGADELVRALDPAQAEARRSIVREIIARGLQARAAEDRSLAIAWLRRWPDEPGLTASDRAWGVGKQAELQLRSGETDAAISRLLRELQAPAIEAGDRAALHLLLGRGYLATDQDGLAAKHLQTALGLSAAESAPRAEAGILLAMVAEKRGELAAARDAYSALVETSAATPWRLAALLGLGRVTALLGDDHAAIELLAEVADEIATRGESPELPREAVAASLLALAQARTASGTAPAALGYAGLAERLYPQHDVPPEVLRVLADGQRRRAERLLEEAAQKDPAAGWQERLAPELKAEIDGLLRRAGESYTRLAQRQAGGSSEDFSIAAWASAECFERAGDFEAAQAALTGYLAGATQEDPRRAEAAFRLGVVLLARGRPAEAAQQFEAVLRGQPRAALGAASGPWADRSIVPLARAYLHDTDPANDADAERLLLLVVEGGRLAPEAAEFGVALVELGRVYLVAGRYPEAIRRFSEALARYPEMAHHAQVVYDLAECHRLAARAARPALEGALPREDRLALEAEVALHLEEAGKGYRRARDEYTARQGPLSALEAAQLRNASFFVGDCAFDQGRYAEAIEAYDAARRRYAHDPAALVAAVQIVSAHVKQGEWAQARAAHERARSLLAKLPESVWESPDLPMSRAHWEQWLESSIALEQQATAPAGTTASADTEAP